MASLFDARGNWLETETKMKAGQLPQSVTTAIGERSTGFKIREVEMVASPKWEKACEEPVANR